MGMGAGLDDAKTALTMTVLYVVYAVYIALGLIACVVGAIYWSRVASPSLYNPGAIFAAGGFCMMVVGAFAIYTIRVKNWLFMAVVEIINFALLIFTMVAAIIALTWA